MSARRRLGARASDPAALAGDGLDEPGAPDTDATAAGTGPSRRSPRAVSRLYQGQTSFDFVGRKRVWLTLSALIIVAGVISLGVRGLNLGIDFKGGTSWTIQAPGVSQSQVTKAVEAAGLNQPVVEILGSGAHQQVEVQADLLALSPAQQASTKAAVTAAVTKLGRGAVNTEDVGPTWGGEVTQHALIALLAFFAAVTLYISIRFEYKMAVAALLAVIHDLLVTVGVYSLAGFQVTPDTVIAILTILGYSLYDTVVVFDRVQENTKGVGSTGRITYSEMINLSMNQTLARSINTSLVAILPVLAVLLVGAELLGATTLQQYGLALVVGLLSGAYSSIFIASPVLAILKEREPRYQVIRQRLASRGGERVGVLTPATVALAGAGAGRGGAGRPAGGRDGRPARSGALRPGVARAGATKAATTSEATTNAAATTKAAATKAATTSEAATAAAASEASAGTPPSGDGALAAAGAGGGTGTGGAPVSGGGAPGPATGGQRGGTRAGGTGAQRRPPSRAQRSSKSKKRR